VARRSLATLEDRSSIPGAGNNNAIVTKSDWPTLVSSVSASADRDVKPGSNYWGYNTVRVSREINITRAYTITIHTSVIFSVENEMNG